MKTGLGLVLWAWVPAVAAPTTIAPAARHACGANCGWATAGDPDRPRIGWPKKSLQGFACGANVGYRRYRIQPAPDLAGTWADSGLGAFQPDPGTTTARQVTVPAKAAGFVAVVVLPPLFP